MPTNQLREREQCANNSSWRSSLLHQAARAQITQRRFRTSFGSIVSSLRDTGNTRIIAETAPGGLFDHWRPATSTEILAFVHQAAGLSLTFGTNYYAPGTLQALNLGLQGDGSPAFRAAFFAEADRSFGVFSFTSQWFCGRGGMPACNANPDAFVLGYGEYLNHGRIFSPYSAVQLVALEWTPPPAVPEPSSYLMLLDGASILGAACRYRWQRKG
ncbi:MAG TPA: PEP-CTERM sorting domain-containing protein [Roseateles sp.]